MNKKEIKEISKVDLHLHLLGSFRHIDLWKLCQKYNPEISFEEFEKLMSFKTFDEFSAAWKFKNSLIKSYEDFAFLVDGFINQLKADNVIYVEPAIALFELTPLDPITLLDIVYKGLKKSGIEFSFIMDLIRGDGCDELLRQYEIYRSVAEKYQIRGVGLAGNEEKHGLNDDLIPLFEKAKKDGFRITIHASEHGNIANIEKAITKFGADRIGHANYIDYKKFSSLAKLISENKIFLEFIPSSIASFHDKGFNQISNDIFNQLFSEQLNDYYSEEIPNFLFNINSDDTGMYDITLNELLEDLAITTNLNINTLTILNFTAIKASFAPEKVKEKLIDKILVQLQKQPE